MLEKILPQYYETSIEPVDKTEINGIKPYQILPEKITDKDVINAEKSLGELEMKDVLMQKYSDIALRIQEKSLAINATRLKHREKSNDNSQKFKRQMLNHQKHEILNRLDNASLTASTEGFQTGFDSVAKNIIL